ncbi:MAG: aspartate-semialdehyde dehydrogenase [Deltaproteobacteria bacterium]|nr:MAG: aspartate-semialdehyde dehydrogenase [Deltaproteobacteria bacterium]
MSEGYVVAVCGATGAVGREMVEVLAERDFPVRSLRLFASERSEGEKIAFRGQEVEVRRLTEDAFEGVDLALFSAGSEVSRHFAPIAARSGAVVVDNSSAWRMDPEVPLVVPEVNPEDLAGYEAKGIVANPNCSTIQLVVALSPLHRAAGLTQVRVSTYQSVSGAGQKGIEELSEQTRRLFNSLDVEARCFPHRIAFNLIPQIDVFEDSGYTREEMKMVRETRKILHAPDLPVSATCVRVPVFFGHSESVALSTREPLAPETAREILAAAPGVKVLDAPEEQVYPMPLLASGDDATLVGRIRRDLIDPNGLELFVVADNVRKGAATNAVQIAECLAAEHL